MIRLESSRRGIASALLLLLAGLGPAWSQPAQDPPDLLTRALERAQADDLEGAVALLEPAVAASDVDPRLPATLGALYVRLNRHQDALRVLEPLATGDDANPAVLYNAGVAALRTGNTQLAEDYLTRSTQALPGSPAARVLGLMHQAQGRTEAAYLHLKPWALQHPEDIEARVAAAMSAVYLYRAAEAEDLLSEIPTDNPQVRLIWSKIFLQKGDTWSALAMAQPTLENAPPELDPELRSIAADAYLQLEQPDSAIDVLQGHVKGRARLAWRLAEAKRLANDLPGAIETLEPFAARLLSTEAPPNEAVPGANSQLLLIHGRHLLEAERPADAVPVLERAVGLAEGSSLAWSALSQALSEVGRTEEANAASARANDLLLASGALAAPTNEDGEGGATDAVARSLRRAWVLVDAGRPEEALALLRKEQKLNPADIRPLLVEAQVLLSLGRKLPALQVTHLALQAFPGNADALYYRGVVNMSRNELESAEADLRSALEAAPNHTAAMGDLAVLLASQGKREEARALWQQVLEIRPGDPTAMENLAALNES